MATTKETRNWSKIGAPSMQIPIMDKSVGVYPSQPKSNMIESAGVQSSMSIPVQNKRNDKNKISYKYMNKSNLSKLTKNQLIELLLNK